VGKGKGRVGHQGLYSYRMYVHGSTTRTGGTAKIILSVVESALPEDCTLAARKIRFVVRL
jgi:hypothetical protein